MTPTEFRSALRWLRLPQRQFASLLGVAPTTVGRWAQGSLDPRTGLPTPIPQYAVAYIELLRRHQEVVDLLRPRVS